MRVAEAPRRHEQQPQRERVARDDPLQLVGLRVQAPLDARQGDVDDRDVEQRHEPGREDDPKGHPAVRVGAVFVVHAAAAPQAAGHGPRLVGGAHAVAAQNEQWCAEAKVDSSCGCGDSSDSTPEPALNDRHGTALVDGLPIAANVAQAARIVAASLS